MNREQWDVPREAWLFGRLLTNRWEISGELAES